VEQGIAPDALPAASAKREFTRPLCSYPQVARYDGSGSTSEAANFVCAARR
jgi:feruloyl esterase